MYISLEYGDPKIPRVVRPYHLLISGVASKTIDVKQDLPPRVLSEYEIAAVKTVLFNLLANYQPLLDFDKFNLKQMLTTIEEFIYFFHLLTLPENHIKTQSGQYVSKPYNTRTYADMAGEMAQLLPALKPYNAYVRVVTEGKDADVLKQKITTKPLPDAIGQKDEATAIQLTRDTYCRERTLIGEEIRQRATSWKGEAPEPRPGFR